MTSILRTYYAWEIVQSRDISYNVCKMGFWTFAEIAIGIIVSCMPVLPKFFRHFGPKLYGAIISKSKSDSNPELRCPSSVVIEKPRNLANSKKHFPIGSQESDISYMWSESYQPLAEVKREYITLNAHDATLLRRGTTSDLTPKIARGTATRRDDLESGQDGFIIGRNNQV